MTVGWPNRTFGTSDDQESDENALRRLAAAIVEMRGAIEDVNKTSVLVEIEPSAFEDFVHDQCPTSPHWWEKIRAARHL
jgi:hypothetical protein